MNINKANDPGLKYRPLQAEPDLTGGGTTGPPSTGRYLEGGQVGATQQFT